MLNIIRILALVAVPAAASAQPLERKLSGPVELLRRQCPPGLIAPVETVAVFNGESAKMFATKVQPVLANLCANCHARADLSTNFKLRRIDEGYANPQATEFNLRAAARQLNRSNPAASPLLVKAVTPHGTAKEPPLRGKQLPPYKVLELWVHWAVLNEGSPMPTSLTPAVVRSPFVGIPGTTEFAVGGDTPVAAKPTEPPPAIVPVGTTVEHVSIGTKAGAMPALPAAPVQETPGEVPAPGEDPFDPAQFNRYAHPQRK
jgi:hypothetical protein